MTQTDETKHTEWILYQIGSDEPNKYRFVVTNGFNDDEVTKTLAEGEFIDSTSTLLGELGGDVTVIDTRAANMLAVLKEADRLLGYFHWDSSTGRTDKFEMVQKIRAAITEGEELTGD